MQARWHEGTKAQWGAARAFTLVELLIVITVIGLLTAIIAWVASRALHAQKISVTQSIMSNVMLSIEQFKQENPLGKTLYDRRGAATFGAFPPYQLHDPDTNQSATLDNTVGEALEPDTTADQFDPPGEPDGLKKRLARDIIKDPTAYSDTDRIVLDNAASTQTHNDNRALYAYLRVYAKKTLAQVPSNAIKPLTNMGEFINPSADTLNPEYESKRVEILGIHDAWGVPLDYMLYVKLERGTRPDGTTGFKIVDRVPVLRSRGVTREQFDAGAAPKDKMIYSPAFPTPPANVDDQGAFQAPFNSSSNGWARVKALEETYGYVPSQDP